MLVPGLEKLSLFTMLSGDNVDYSCVYESLCQCAKEMLDKYKQKQLKPMCSEKLEIKARAVMVLLIELRKVKEGSRATCDIISEALKRHAEMLQDHEHLLSEKGNTYELMKQTQRLREGHTTASLLRYHALKNKFLGPDTPLEAEEKEVVSRLAEKKYLTLKILEALEKEKAPCRIRKALVALHKADMLEPGWCARVGEHKDSIALTILRLGIYHLLTDENLNQVLKHEYPLIAASALVTLDKEGLFELELRDGALKHKKPLLAATALVLLVNYKLCTPNNFYVVLKHEDPFSAASAIVELHSCDLLTDENQDKVLKHKESFIAARALTILCKEGLFEPELYDGVLKHKEPHRVLNAFMNLKEHNLHTPDNYFMILEHEYPDKAAMDLIASLTEPISEDFVELMHTIDLDSKDWTEDMDYGN